MCRVWPVAREAVDYWLEHGTPQTAAGLAYYTVCSLAPLLLIAISIAGLVLGQQEAREQMVQQATALVGSSGQAAVEGMLGDAGEAPTAGAIGTIIGLFTLLVGAVGVLAQLKSALNTVWHVEAPPFSWSGLIGQYFSNMALVVATGFLLMVSLCRTRWCIGATSAPAPSSRRRSSRWDASASAGTWVARAGTRPTPRPGPSSRCWPGSTTRRSSCSSVPSSRMSTRCVVARGSAR